MAESKIQTVQLADGTKISGYAGEFIFERIRQAHGSFAQVARPKCTRF